MCEIQVRHNKPILSDNIMSSCLLQKTQKPRQHTFAPDPGRYVSPIPEKMQLKRKQEMRSRILIIVTTGSLMFLGGCASKVFVHDTKSAEQFERDRYDCQMVATQYTANLGFAGNPLIIRDETAKCLTIKYGWREQVE